MGYFPFFMDIAGKRGVIAGGGKVAARKVEKLLAFGPELVVIAPQIEECIRIQEKLFKKDGAASLIFHEREIRAEDLDHADFVIAATNDEGVNSRISAYCRAERIPVNVADDREKCSFFFPALVREGGLTVGVSTDGKSPLAASWIRKEIERVVPDFLGDIIDLLSQIRPLVLEAGMEESARKELLEKMFQYCMEREGNVTVNELEERFLQ